MTITVLIIIYSLLALLMDSLNGINNNLKFNRLINIVQFILLVIGSIFLIIVIYV
ncbi:hypothetical protein II5_06078 [Bacillus cereus MSX-A1]|nr:hypothetical protein II5_06078 [Bacillus cereus MSX-A1]